MSTIRTRPAAATDFSCCLPRQVEAHAAATPDAMAIVYGEWRLTYRDLNAAANRLARRLLAAGVGGGSAPGPVGLCLSRGPDLLVALLAVLKVRASYLALDPSWPAERLARMVATAAPRLVVSRAALRGLVATVDPAGTVPVLDLDREQGPIRASSSADLAEDILPADDCYLMFTSGSTGTPRGVALTHGNLANLFPPLTAALDLGPEDIWTWFHSCSFGFSVWEIWGALMHGGCLVVVPETMRADPAALGELLVDEQVTVFSQTPSAFRRLLDSPEFHAAVRTGPLRYLALSGEAIRHEDVARWLARHAGGTTRLISTYAITETGGQLTLRDYGSGDEGAAAARNIGRPLDGRIVLVLDADRHPVAAGEAGELWVGGDCIAAGYLGDPAATAQRFATVVLPEGGSLRAYRSGDRVRLLADGSLEFLGRVDDQLKFRGYRIEPGEIEAALRDHPRVRDAAVAIRDDVGGAPRLVAYVVADDPATAGDIEARDIEAGDIEESAAVGAIGFWPSVGDWGVYDEFLYGLMNAEPVRLAAYREAFARHVPGKVVLDIGTGQDAVLARLCAEAGARHVYAVEILPDAARRARELVARLGLGGRITVIEGDIGSLTLPEPVEVCTQGVIGNIGSADGIVSAWNAARRGFAAGCVPIPARCVTRIAAVELPAATRDRPRFEPAAAAYARRIFAAAGEAFDLRLCVRDLPPAALLTDDATFEDLDFSAALPDTQRGRAELRVGRSGLFDGLLLWTVVDVADDVAVVDYLERQQAWLPVFLPLPGEPLAVAAGDVLTLDWEIRTASDPRCPDYEISGHLRRRSGFSRDSFPESQPESRLKPAPTIRITSPHHATTQGGTTIHRLLLADLDGQAGDLSVSALRDWLGARLPEYMIPQSWQFIADLPLNPSGKLDRDALPAPGRDRPALTVAWAAARTPLEAGLATLWSEALGIDRPGIDDDFFDLGGDSITAVQLTSATQRWLDDGVPLAALFDAPTIAAMARWLEAHHAAAVAKRLAAESTVSMPGTASGAERDSGEL